MSVSSKPTCRIVRPGSTYAGKQGLSYFKGIAAETVGSTEICMHLLTIQPGARAKALLHASHETPSTRLEEHLIVHEGEMFYISGQHRGHLPANLSDGLATPARTDPNKVEKPGPAAGFGAACSALSSRYAD